MIVGRMMMIHVLYTGHHRDTRRRRGGGVVREATSVTVTIIITAAASAGVVVGDTRLPMPVSISTPIVVHDAVMVQRPMVSHPRRRRGREGIRREVGRGRRRSRRRPALVRAIQSPVTVVGAVECAVC